MAMNGGCGFPVINFGPKVEGEPLKCGTKLYWNNPKGGTIDFIVLCKSCTEKQAAEEEATAPTKETHAT